MDETNFSRNVVQNFHNNHIWVAENPHAITTLFQKPQFPKLQNIKLSTFKSQNPNC